jgi:hypothetical protein
MYLDQSAVIESFDDLLPACLKESGGDFTQREQFAVADVLPLVLCERKKIDGAIRSETDQHPKSTSLALTRSSDSLLDDLTAKFRIDQPPSGALNGFDKALVANAMLPGKLGERSGLEDAQGRLSIIL